MSKQFTATAIMLLREGEAELRGPDHVFLSRLALPGFAISNDWMTKATNRELNDLVFVAEAEDSTGWEGLSESDRRLVESFVVANLRLYETVFHQVDGHLLPENAMEALGWTGFGSTRLVQRTWARVRDRVTPGFARYLESITPELKSR